MLIYSHALALISLFTWIIQYNYRNGPMSFAVFENNDFFVILYRLHAHSILIGNVQFEVNFNKILKIYAI